MTRISVKFSEYPELLQDTIFNLTKSQGHTIGLGPESIRKITDPLGQLLFVAKREHLDYDFNINTLAAYIREIDARDIKYTTRSTYLTGLAVLAKALEWDREYIKRIYVEIDYYRKASISELPEKEKKLLRNPITLEDIAVAADYWFEMALACKNDWRKRSNLQRAGFLAFSSIVPNRVGEIRRYIVDEDIVRVNDHWLLSTESKKTQFPMNVPLDHSLNRYIDALIHFGDHERFEVMLRMRSGTPLFLSLTGNIVSREALWYHFRKATGGHSPHIVRSLVYDFFAAVDDPRSAKIAQALCGHYSGSMAPTYEVSARREKFARAQKLLEDAQLGVDSGRGQDDTLSAISVSPDDICDGVFRDAEVAGDPSV